jgi:flagellar hook-length control protein FliK
MVFDAAQPGSAGRVAAHGAPQDAAQTGADLRAAQQAPAVPVSAVPIEIGMRALAGAQSFQIRLHPEEYGRVDVKLDISDDGSVSAQISTDRVEALTMLQRDAKTLERAFEQAGLKTNENSLQFSLNNSGGENAARDQAGREQQHQHRRSPGSPTPDPKAIPADLAAALRSIRTGATGLDIQI